MTNFVRKLKPITSILLVILMVSMIVPFSTFGVASAADPTPLTLKWASSNVAGGGESLLTYDIFPSRPGEEVVHGGGPVAPNSGGSVTVLDGVTGATIWKRTGIPNLGDTAQLTMADLDNDGDMEIVVPLQHPAGIYILNAEDGTTFWSQTNLGGGRIDSSPVVGDIDGDNYPDVFVGVMAWADETFGYEPSTGKVIRYEWTGATMAERDRIEVWHPCAGGLSLSDTDNDGVWELYMNERDAYFGDGSWGRGIMSFWASNLTVRWQVYDWGPSSNIPMIADVNKDGILDIVSTDLGRGVTVLNSTNGQPLRNDDGTLLSSDNLPRRNHYQSSISDIDGDGNYEVLSADGWEAGYNYATVWDLWDWTLDAEIDTTALGPWRSWKGPTVGEVTGDGIMDIIITCFETSNANNGSLQVYDQNYNLVHLNMGLRHRAIDSVVQDVDFDGLNELLVLTQGGWIYCFETAGLSEVSLGRERARSEVQFYSELRNGVSEFIPYNRPWADVLSTTPLNGAVGVSTGLTSLSFNLNHPEGELMDYEVISDPDIISGSGTGTNVGNGLRSVSIAGPLAATTLYSWNLTITDASGHVFTKCLQFHNGASYTK